MFHKKYGRNIKKTFSKNYIFKLSNRQIVQFLCGMMGRVKKILPGKRGQNMQWSKPKSVRQIGEIPSRGRIYMEDYVIRFARQLAERGKTGEKAAVLLGNYYTYNGDKIYQISGIVEIENFEKRNSVELTSEMWDNVYSLIKENFTDLEILGWFYTQNGFSVNEAPKLLEIHRKNFCKGDKILYVYEADEREDRFFVYRTGQLEKQKGYFVYYEKNPEMLHYMEKENDRHIHIVEQEDDRVVRNIRGIMREKEQKKERRQQRETHMGRSIAGMVALIAILIGAVTVKNQTTLNQMKEQLRSLQTMAQPGHTSGGNRTSVETRTSTLKKPAATALAASPAATSGGALQMTPAASPAPVATPVQSPVAK